MSEIRVGLLWLWISYFFLMSCRAWYLSYLHAQAGNAESMRYQERQLRHYAALACAAYVAWLWLSGQGR